jgi:hypothetical protein
LESEPRDLTSLQRRAPAKLSFRQQQKKRRLTEHRCSRRLLLHPRRRSARLNARRFWLRCSRSLYAQPENNPPRRECDQRAQICGLVNAAFDQGCWRPPSSSFVARSSVAPNRNIAKMESAPPATAPSCGPSRSSRHRAAEAFLSRARFCGSHPPRDKDHERSLGNPIGAAGHLCQRPCSSANSRKRKIRRPAAPIASPRARERGDSVNGCAPRVRHR